MSAAMTLPEGVKTRLGRTIGYGLWAGAVLGTAGMYWNVSRFGAQFPDLASWTFSHALIYVSVGAVVGFVFWGGYILKG